MESVLQKNQVLPLFGLVAFGVARTVTTRGFDTVDDRTGERSERGDCWSQLVHLSPRFSFEAKPPGFHGPGLWNPPTLRMLSEKGNDLTLDAKSLTF